MAAGFGVEVLVDDFGGDFLVEADDGVECFFDSVKIKEKEVMFFLRGGGISKIDHAANTIANNKSLIFPKYSTHPSTKNKTPQLY